MSTTQSERLRALLEPLVAARRAWIWKRSR